MGIYNMGRGGREGSWVLIVELHPWAAFNGRYMAEVENEIEMPKLSNIKHSFKFLKFNHLIISL